MKITNIDINFMKEWCLEIIFNLSKEYKSQAFINHKIYEVNNSNKKTINEIYRVIHSMALAESSEIKEKINDNLEKKFGKNLNDIQPIIVRKRVSDEKLAEYLLIKDVCITILDFFASKKESRLKDFSESTITLINNFFEQGISDGFELRMLGGFKEMHRDFLEMAKALHPTDYAILHELLISKYGVGLFDAEKKTKKLVNKIIKRGTIKSDEEWRLINEIASDTAQQEYSTDILNSLLSNYEFKKN